MWTPYRILLQERLWFPFRSFCRIRAAGPGPGPSGFGLPTSKPASPSWKERPRTLCTWRRARKRAGLCRLRHYATQNYGTSTIPHLYRLRVVLTQHDQDFHALESTFGVRSIEIRTRAFYLNGMRVWLAGVERMAGSNPEFGMAEPAGWLTHDHDDLKQLNCVFTRVHWQQDRRVLEYCDRHGILIQTEVPTWGPDTFQGMGNKPAAEIMENGLEQLREMIARDRNHPCIFSWGLCNEINGQNPSAYEFAKGMLEEAKNWIPGGYVPTLRTPCKVTLQKTSPDSWILWNGTNTTKVGIKALRQSSQQCGTDPRGISRQAHRNI